MAPPARFDAQKEVAVLKQEVAALRADLADLADLAALIAELRLLRAGK